MRCDQLPARIDELLDRRLEVSSDAEIAAHVATCSCCARIVRGYDALILGVDLLAGAEPEDQFVERTVATIRQRGRAASGLRGLMAIAIAAVLLIAIGPSLLSILGLRHNLGPRAVENGGQKDSALTRAGLPLPTGLSTEALAKLMQETGRGLASLPQAVRRVAKHPETDRIVGHIRPLTESVGATWDALMRSLPGATPSDSIEETDTGYVRWDNARHV
jgi:hypothetical protein